MLDMSGVLEEALQTGGDVDEMASVFGANPGYLNVGLRMLCSQGILDAHLGEDKITYISIKEGDVAHWAKKRHLYELGRNWMDHSVGMWNRPNDALRADALQAMRALLNAVVELGVDMESTDVGATLESRIAIHLEGALVAPWMVLLGTAFGTEAMNSWEDVGKATASLHPGLQEAWGEVALALGWSGSDIGAFYLHRGCLRCDHVVHPNVLVGQGIVVGRRQLVVAHRTWGS